MKPRDASYQTLWDALGVATPHSKSWPPDGGAIGRTQVLG